MGRQRSKRTKDMEYSLEKKKKERKLNSRTGKYSWPIS